jgi:hypothetical protein
MPSSKNYKRDYKQELKTQKQRGEDKDKVKRVQARRKLEKEGKVSKGDGKDVDHRKPLRSGGSNSRSNLRVRSKSSNRSVPRKRSAKKYAKGKKK